MNIAKRLARKLFARTERRADRRRERQRLQEASKKIDVFVDSSSREQEIGVDPKYLSTSAVRRTGRSREELRAEWQAAKKAWDKAQSRAKLEAKKGEGKQTIIGG